MGNQLNVNLAFNADTGKAKQQIQELQTLLNNITYSGSGANSLNITKEVREASNAAKELQYHLNNAFNASTGNFDLSKLDKSLKTSGTNITELSTKLLGAGETGQEAFAKLAQSISNADRPMLKINSALKDMGTTLKNTVKWQISSNIIHDFQSALNSAVGYAKDLNRSLNDIRIVTGMNTDEMAKFADEANKAAKNLSTTTTDYTDAALIYYQQGLSDQEVKARTDITIKMANAAGASAQTVSDQMTAIWNNFNDGTKTLEYYADGITKLGAETASSTDEIIEGVQKFASVTDTIGLSFEYATAALATVTAETRESASTVGTAFRTIFSRLEGLQLGETLDDGTDLNKYSQALDTVGVEIKDASGNLRDMDDILDDLGNRWQSLARDEQIALAQTVAGVRQYTQLIALMDKWDVFKENVSRVEGSAGTLQEQADIYAESWEAARNRVKAAQEGIYQDLLDDDLFISFNNGFANILGGLDSVIEGMGGLKGVITYISGLFLTNFAHKIPQALSDLKYNFTVLTKGTEEAYNNINKEIQAASYKAFTKIQPELYGEGKTDSSGQIASTTNLLVEDNALVSQIKTYNQLADAKNKLAQVSNTLTAAEKQQYETELMALQLQQEEVVNLKKKQETLTESSQKVINTINTNYDTNFAKHASQIIDSFGGDNFSQAAGGIFTKLVFGEELGDNFTTLYGDIFKNFEQLTIPESVTNANKQVLNDLITQLEKVKGNLTNLATSGENLELKTYFSDLINPMKELVKVAGDFGSMSAEGVNSTKQAFVNLIKGSIDPAILRSKALREEFAAIENATDGQSLEKALKGFIKQLDEGKIKATDFRRILDSMGGSKNFYKLVNDFKQGKITAEQLKEAILGVNATVNNFNPKHIVSITESLSRSLGGITQAVSGIRALQSAISSLGDESLNGWEKFSSLIAGISIGVPNLIQSMRVSREEGSRFLETFKNTQKHQQNLKDLANVTEKYNSAKIFSDNLKKQIEEFSRAKQMAKGDYLKQINLLEDKENKYGLSQDVKDEVLRIIQNKETSDDEKFKALEAMSDYAGDNSGTKRRRQRYDYFKQAKEAINQRSMMKNAGQAIGELDNQSKEAAKNVKNLGDKVEDVERVTSESAGLEQFAFGLSSTTLAVVALSVALIALVAHIAYVNSSAYGLKQISESVSKYEESKSEVENLKESLKSLQNSIEALEESGPLTLTQKEDLLNLKAQEASLKKELLLKQKINDLNRESAINTFDKNREKVLKSVETKPKYEKDISGDEDLEKYGGFMGETITYDQYYQSYIKNLEEIYTEQEENAESEWLSKNIENYNSFMSGYNLKMAELLQNNTPEDVLNDLATDAQTWQKAMFGDDYAASMIASMEETRQKEKLSLDNVFTSVADGSQNVSDIAAELANNFSSSFKESLYTAGIVPKDYAQELVTAIDEVQNNVDSEVFEELQSQITDASDWAIVAQMDLTGEESVEDIIKYIDENDVKVITVEINVKEGQRNVLKVLEGLSDGGTIEKDIYDLLPEDLKKYFTEDFYGDFQLTGTSAEDILDQVRNSYIEGYKKEQQSQLDYNKFISDNEDIDIENITTRFREFEKTGSGYLINGLSEESNAGMKYKQVVGDFLGITFKTIPEAQQALDKYTNTFTGNIDEIGNNIAQLSNSFDELDDLLQNNSITKEQYDSQINRLITDQAQDSDIEIEDAFSIQDNYQEQILEDYGDMNLQSTMEFYSKQIAELNKSYNEGKISLQDYKKELKTLEKTLNDLSEESENVTRTTAKMTARNLRAQKGIKTLTDNWEDWSKAIKRGGLEAEQAYRGMTEAVADIADIDIEEVPEGFVQSAEGAKLLEEAVNGSAIALQQIQALGLQDTVTAIEFQVEGEETVESAISSMMNDLLEIANVDPTITPMIDNSQAYAGLNNLLESGQITVADLNNVLGQIGWEPNIEWKEMSVGEAQKIGAKYYVKNAHGDYDEVTMDGSMDSGATVYVPYIKSISKSGGAPSFKPPSGGGGSGGNKTTAKTHEKKSDSDKERYHTIQNQMEDLESVYDDVSEAKDRAFGLERVSAIEDEIKATDDLIDKQKEYLDAISYNLPIDKNVMTQYYQELIGGPAIEFDATGNISNFDAIQDAMYNKYNQMAGQVMEDEQWEIFEKKYEQLEKYIEQYEETYDLLRDEESKYQELLNQRMDLELEKIQTQIELKLNVAEDGLNLLEYRMEKLEDDAFKAAEAIGLFGQKAELLYDQMVADRKGLNDILGQQLSAAEIRLFYEGNMDVLKNKNFTEDQIDAIKDYRDNLLDLNSEMDEIRNSVEEKVLEVFDAWNEKLDEGIEKFEYYNDTLENYKNIIDIVGEDALGISDKFMADLGQASIDTAIDKVLATKEAYDAMVAMQKEAEEKLAAARAINDEKSIEHWEEVQKQLSEEMEDAQGEFMSAWEEALNSIAEQFELSVERIIDNFSKTIYETGLAGLSEEFSRQQDLSSIMVDDYQKIYELSKLSRDIEKNIDNSENIAGKQKLKKLLEQINALEADGVEMSQYDLEYLQKTYDLRLAEIELEEAQRAKSVVRLSKDNEGNWSYVYTQNADVVDQAQQKYEDALYAMQDLSSNYIDEMSQKLIETSQEMEEALAAIRIQDFASIEEYYAEVERVQAQYQDELAMQQAELQKAIDNNKTLYDEDWTNYSNATGYKISATEDFVTSFKDSMLGLLMGSEEDQANFTGLIGQATETLMTELLANAETYYKNLEDAMSAAGTSTGDFAEDIKEDVNAIIEKSQEGTEAIEQMAEDMQEAFGNIADTVQEWQNSYGLAMEAIIQSNLDVIESFNEMLEALSINPDDITVRYNIQDGIDDVEEPSAFDTGGYTGEWGRKGKLGILHEKELILNETDTENFLDSLKITKSILDTIELNARHAETGIGSVAPAQILQETHETLEQMVSITAEFPNVTNHSEIEAAFDTLINRSAQYANRKNI